MILLPNLLKYVYFFVHFLNDIFKLTHEVDDDDERETDQLLRDPDDQGFFDEHVSYSSFVFLVMIEVFTILYRSPSLVTTIFHCV